MACCSLFVRSLEIRNLITKAKIYVQESRPFQSKKDFLKILDLDLKYLGYYVDFEFNTHPASIGVFQCCYH